MMCWTAESRYSVFSRSTSPSMLNDRMYLDSGPMVIAANTDTPRASSMVWSKPGSLSFMMMMPRSRSCCTAA